jgi:prolipoprotein diacylglyceryltransferase
MIPPDAVASLTVHPLQLYLAANGLLVFFVVSAVWRRSTGTPGLTLAAYLTLYGASRFCWEFFRDPAAGGAVSSFSVSQMMCLAFLLAGAILLAHRLPLRSSAATPAIAQAVRPRRMTRSGGGVQSAPSENGP